MTRALLLQESELALLRALRGLECLRVLDRRWDLSILTRSVQLAIRPLEIATPELGSPALDVTRVAFDRTSDVTGQVVCDNAGLVEEITILRVGLYFDGPSDGPAVKGPIEISAGVDWSMRYATVDGLPPRAVVADVAVEFRCSRKTFVCGTDGVGYFALHDQDADGAARLGEHTQFRRRMPLQ